MASKIAVRTRIWHSAHNYYTDAIPFLPSKKSFCINPCLPIKGETISYQGPWGSLQLVVSLVSSLLHLRQQNLARNVISGLDLCTSFPALQALRSCHVMEQLRTIGDCASIFFCTWGRVWCNCVWPLLVSDYPCCTALVPDYQCHFCFCW